MGNYILKFDLGGYEDAKSRQAAELEFIYENLNFSASSVKVTPYSCMDCARRDEVCEHDIPILFTSTESE